MIDYKKLKLAHDLAHETNSAIRHDVASDYRTGMQSHCFELYRPSTECLICNLDIIIEKLTELSKKKSKYKVGEKVWIEDYREYPTTPLEITLTDESGNAYYGVGQQDGDDHYWKVPKEYVYPTRDALVETKIAYWQSLLEPSQVNVDKCQHETDGTKHWSAAYDDDVYICLKCGEFYR